MRVAIAGCGMFARVHANAWRETGGAEVVAVCDRDPARLASFGASCGDAARFATVEAMLEGARPDVLDVVTGPGDHAAPVRAAIRRGLPVICQKPLAGTLEEARMLSDEAAAAGVSLVVHENFRYQRPMRAVKQDAGGIGTLAFARISFRTPYDIYAVQPYLARGDRFILEDLGVHLLDLARWFFDADPDRLSCVTARVNPAIRGEDVATVLLAFPGGAAAVCDMSYAAHTEEDLFPQTLVGLEGARGSVTLGPHYRQTTVTPEGVVRRDIPPGRYAWSRSPGEVVQDGAVAFCRAYVENRAAGRPHETHAVDNVRTLELVHGAYESARTGRDYIPTWRR